MRRQLGIHVTRNGSIIPIVIAIGLLLASGTAARAAESGASAAAERAVRRQAPATSVPHRLHKSFTAFPYDISQEAIDATYDFIASNADLITFHLDNKVPWPEALAGDDRYHPNVIGELDDMIANIPPGHLVYVSSTPQNTARAGELAAYWAESDLLPLPPGWEDKTHDDPEVIAAFTNWCRYLIRRFEPDYFAYSIETNGGFAGPDDPAFQRFLVLAESVYGTLKSEHPELPVFLTVQTGSFVAGGQDFLDATELLLEHSDYVGVSSYPYLIADPDRLLTFGDPRELPADVLSRIADLAPHKTFAVTETGYIAETLDIPDLGIYQEGRPEWQAAYVRLLLAELARLESEFVVWFVSRDHDLLNERLIDLGVELDATFLLWRDTGLLDGLGSPRPGLSVWRQWRRGGTQRLP